MNKNSLRIVSLVPSLTETLCHFGLTEQIAGCTSFCTEPRLLRHTVPSVGGTKDARTDDIVKLKPTHIVVNREENTQALLKELKAKAAKHGFEIVETFPETPADNFSLITSLGSIFGFSQAAGAWITRQKEELERLIQSMSGSNGFTFAYFIWMNPWMVAGSKTYISNTMALIQGNNSFSTGSELQERYPAVQTDDARLRDTEVMLFSSEPFPFRSRHIDEFRRQSEIFRPCLKVDGQALSWYGSRFAKTVTYLGRLHAQIQEALD